MLQLLDQLDSDDILLVDKYFCSYFMIAQFMEQNVDIVARLHHARKQDAYRVKRLGKKDYLVSWQRPVKPEWMDQANYDRMPKTLTVRQIEVAVTEPGFRVESLVVVTTLTDVKQYSRDDLAELHHRRWLAGLDIRAPQVHFRNGCAAMQNTLHGAQRNLGLHVSVPRALKMSCRF